MIRTVVELAVGLAVALVLRHGLPLAAGDPFHSTLVLLPLWIASLRSVERGALRRGARRLGGRRAAAVEGVALGALVILTLSRGGLGLPATEAPLAAAFVVVLGHRVLRTAIGLRPLLGRRLPARPAAAFFLLPWLVYLALLPWSTEHRPPDGDEPHYLLITDSLAFDLDADLGNQYAGEAWRRFLDRPLEPQPGDPGGGAYSRHTALLPAALAPAYRVAGRWGALATMAALAAALAWASLALARHFFPERPAVGLFAWALLAFAPPLVVYSYQVWIEVPAALLTVLALDGIWRHRGRGELGREGFLAVALPIVLLPLLKLRLILVALPLLALAVWRLRPGRRGAAGLAAVVAAGLGALFLHNWWRFGNALKIHSWSELGDLAGPSAVDLLRGLVGVFWDAAFGLFAAAPLWMLLLPGIWLLIRRRSPLAVDLAVVTLPTLFALGPRIEWYGGWSPPFRYPLVFLPLLALATAPVFERRHAAGARAAIAGLAASTGVLALFWLTVPGWTYNVADGQSHLVAYAGERLAADVGRLFPSAVRPRAATWIWPVVSLSLLPVVLAGRGRPAWRRAAGALGVAAVLGLAAATGLVAARLPTGRIELEDGFVVHLGGRPNPPLWQPQRPAFPGGWSLTGGVRLLAPVVPGGRQAVLRLRLRFLDSDPDPFVLRIAAGEHELRLWEPPGEGWHDLVLGPLEWPAGRPLVLAVPRRGRAGGDAVVVDRVDFEWR